MPTFECMSSAYHMLFQNCSVSSFTWRLNVRIRCILGWEEVLLNITADVQSVSIVMDGPT